MKKEQIEEITKIAAEVALTKRETIIQEEIDDRYHDVKLLMANYRKLKKHYSHISPETLEVSSIYELRRKTGLMMSHVDKMLTVYESICRSAQYTDETRRWEALYLRYITDEIIGIDDIADKLHIDKQTFYRDIGKAMEEMAVLLFGIESIGVWRRKGA
jgi:tyrosyl-tRNA synthetase